MYYSTNATDNIAGAVEGERECRMAASYYMACAKAAVSEHRQGGKVAFSPPCFALHDFDKLFAAA